MPFSTTRVFHDDWEAHHRPVAEGAMTATGTILRHDSAGTFNEATGVTEDAEPDAIYGSPTPGPMRIVRDGVEASRIIGDRDVVIRAYIVALPASAPEVLVGDEVQATTAGDEQLPDKSLWVHDVRYGSQIWERDLVCLNAPPTNR